MEEAKHEVREVGAKKIWRVRVGITYKEGTISAFGQYHLSSTDQPSAKQSQARMANK
ncbi:MAG TPA: hypothetical protein PLZ24_05020 [Flavobacteriales bacterium]|jgi:hypothetical protein|nr:hypothetical protein [Flavobacteriales bacterium]